MVKQSTGSRIGPEAIHQQKCKPKQQVAVDARSGFAASR
jgi:hypothetical protein